MERGEWENDPEYPRAPVPPHERTWRHPSEIGKTEWARTEPPLVVGRGLSVATGTVGAVLALGLLWLMIPHSERGGVAVESSMPLSRSNSTATLLDVQTTSAATDSVPTTPAPVTTMTATSMAVATHAPTTQAPVTTTRPEPEPTTVPQIEVDSTTVSEQLPAVAVALLPGHFVVTTAAAVSGRTEIAVKLSTGDTVMGSVVAVDEASGTAVLSVPIELASPQISATNQAEPSEGVVMNNTANIWSDETGTFVSYDGDQQPHEGSLVLDHDGGLIGMCTKGAKATRLVSVKNLIAAVNDASLTEASVWIGVRAELTAAGELTINTVLPDSPAAAAGLQAADIITAIDGTAVTDLEGFRSTVLAHSPGQTIVLSVTRAGETTPTDITITLSKKPYGF